MDGGSEIHFNRKKPLRSSLNDSNELGKKCDQMKGKGEEKENSFFNNQRKEVERKKGRKRDK